MLLNTPPIDPVLADWFDNLSGSEQDIFLAEVMEDLWLPEDETLPHYDQWLKRHFPRKFSYPLADHHIELWQHVETIQPKIKPSAIFAVLARKGGKSSNVEAIVTRLGARGIRKFCLYVRATQDKANESVQNIAAMIESPSLAKYADYQSFINRKLGKYGHSKGWKVDTLRCDNDFNVVAHGLDAAARGIKIEDFRPDLIILDDIDNDKDSLETIKKKTEIITKTILPTGSEDVAIIGAQNLIHSKSIFSTIVNDSAEFLYDRKVIGPIPAVVNLETKRREDGKYEIVGGTPTWKGQSLAICQQQINDWGLTAFLQEAQHEVDEQKGGMYDHLEYRHCNWDEVPDLVRIVVWCDPAVTNTDKSDANGIQVDGIDEDDIIYRLYSWEQRSTPEDTIKRAIYKAFELGADTLGFETDQGGDLWRTAYQEILDNYFDYAWLQLTNRELPDDLDDLDLMIVNVITDRNPAQELDWDKLTEAELKEARKRWETTIIEPSFASEKAGSIGSKVHRGQLQLAEYEKGRFIHVRGTHLVLERALGRFPVHKPYDCHDSSFYSMWDLLHGRSGLQMVATN